MKGYKSFVLIIWALIIAMATILTLRSTETQKSRHYDLKVKASEIALLAQQKVKERYLELGFTINPEDKNQTGLIGTRYTMLTTTVGHIESKRTSTNPNFAAVIVDMLLEAGVREGDYVGMTFSGSFPALNIAASAAAEAMNLKVVIMASLGASSFGANNPDFTYVDMAEYLYEQKIFSFTPEYVSLGGANDLGSEFPKSLKEELLSRMKTLNKKIIQIEDFSENIEYRKEIFKKYGKMKAFINVGGNLVAMGQGDAVFPNKNGLIKTKNRLYSKDMGLLDVFLNENIPVIHLLDIKRLAYRYGLPIDPDGIPAIGIGGVYLEQKYNIFIPIIAIVVSFIILIFYKYFDKYFE